MVYPTNIEEKLGFDSLRKQLESLCLSPLGVSYVEKMRFIDHPGKITRLIGQTDEFRGILSGEESFPSSNYLDVTRSLTKAKIPGTFLVEEEWYDMMRSLETLLKIDRFFQETEQEYPHLEGLLMDLQVDGGLHKAIREKIDDDGRLRNNASPELMKIRSGLQQSQVRLRKVLDQILREAKSNGFTQDEMSLTVREGRMVIPVQAEHKRRIKGFVHDESATGQTVYLEPAQALDINNEIRELENAERREIVRILTVLTDQLRPHIEALKTSYRFLGRVDFIRAKAKLAISLDAVAPTFVEEPLVEWYQARHPLLQQSHQASGKPVVPLTIRLGMDQRIVVISGPNAGGKSVAMKTVGLLQYMYQCGLLIPVAEASKVGLFRDIFLDIGDEQSLENDLSTYSSHLTHMRKVLTLSGKKSLVLIDEFGSGTEPQFGGALAEAIMEALHKSRAFGVITTHYANLKQFADRKETVVNAAMRYDVDALEPLYELEIGKPGSSFALEIAQKIGLPKAVLESAKKKAGVTHVRMDQTLSKLEKEKKRFEDLNEGLSTKESKAQRALQEYEDLRDFVDQEKKRILNAAKAEAKQMIQEANAQIERTIREIKEAQAAKDATKEARRKLTEHEDKLKPEKHTPSLRKRKKVQPLADVVTEGPISQGDPVRIKGQTAVGEVLAIKGKDAEISIGALKSTVKLNRLEKISRREQRKEEKAAATSIAAFNFSAKRAEFSTQLDLRGQRAGEALTRLEQFLDEALLHGIGDLRILHGKGDGILRELVRNTLKKTNFVDRFEDEHADRGGSGITIVYLS